MNYWQKRQLDELTKSFDTVAGGMDQILVQEYQRCFKEVADQLGLMYQEIQLAKADGTILASDYYRYNAYYQNLNIINQNLLQLGQQEMKLMEQKLIEMYKQSSSIVGSQPGFSKGFNQDMAKLAVKKIWCQDGKHYSSRIWENKTQLQQAIEKGLFDCGARGVSRTELTKEIMRIEQSGFYMADRLARTELAYIQNQATYDKFQEAGIKEYTILDTSDDRCCADCQDKANKVYKLSEAQVGVNYPPFHPHCRCCVLGVVEGGK